MTQEHRDYLLIKELYHCAPNELSKVPEAVLDLHFRYLMEERNHEDLEAKRTAQKAKLSRK